MVSPEGAVARRFRHNGGPEDRQSAYRQLKYRQPRNEPKGIAVDGDTPPATTRDIVKGLLLGLSIGSLIAVGLYAL